MSAQITGQVINEDLGLPGVTVHIKNSDQKVETDFDVYFNLPIPSSPERYDLVFSHFGLTVLIKYVVIKTGKLELKQIELPVFKIIEVDEYKHLTESEKKNCYPIYCWANLLGYTYTNELEYDYLDLNCKQKITDFEFNLETKTVTVDWSIIKKCI